MDSVEVRRKHERFIKKNWRRLSDQQMAAKLKLGLSTVVAMRIALGLKRPRGRPKGVNAKISPGALKRALTEDAKTIVDLAAELDVTKQAVSQWCVAINLDVHRDRQPIWYASRLGKPELSSKGKLKAALRRAGSVMALARELAISDGVLKLQMDRLNVKVPPRPRRAYRKVRCEVCGRTLKRAVKEIRPGQKVFFCKRQCHGYYMGKKNGGKTRTES